MDQTGFFSIMKREELSHNWYHSLDDLQNTVDEYIGFFNTQRPFHRLGNLTPDQFEIKYRMDNLKGKPQTEPCVNGKMSQS